MKNYLALLAGEIFSKLATFAALAFLARTIGPAGFGRVEFAGAVMLCAGLLVDQGLSLYGAREIAKAPERTASLLTEIVGTRFVLAVCAYAVVALFALLHEHDAVITQLLLIYGLSLLVTPLLLTWVFQGHNKMGWVAAAQLIRQLIFAAVVLALVHTASEVWIVGAAEVIAVSCAAAYTFLMYRNHLRPKFARVALRFTVSKQLLKEGVPIGLSQMFWMVKTFGATLLVGLIAQPGDVGFFAAAMRVFVALHTFVWLYYFNFLPALAQSWSHSDDGRQSFHGLVNRSMRFVSWTVAAFVVVWLALAEILVTAVYGIDFAPAAEAMRWLGITCALAAINGHYRYGLLAAGRQAVEMWCSAGGALLAGAALVVGYNNYGLAGAAAGLALVEAVILVVTWWCGRRMLGVHGHTKLLMRPLFTAACVGLLLCGLPLGLSPAVQAVTAALLLPALACAFDGEVRATVRETFTGATGGWRKQNVPAATR